jgi:CheY-like chemotaxis protein
MTKSPVGHRVPVVEYDPAIRPVVAEILELAGYVVRTAARGGEALAKVEAHPPDVNLLDVRMPVLDGWEFARQLRGHAVRPPIAVMTAAASSRAWGTGATI